MIDGKHGGNSSRWINHSCDPNCEADEDDGRVFIKALRDIEAGEELIYDYGLIIDGRYTTKVKSSTRAAAAPTAAAAPCSRPSADAAQRSFGLPMSDRRFALHPRRTCSGAPRRSGRSSSRCCRG